jgi:hypothetical protein
MRCFTATIQLPNQIMNAQWDLHKTAMALKHYSKILIRSRVKKRFAAYTAR